MNRFVAVQPRRTATVQPRHSQNNTLLRRAPLLCNEFCSLSGAQPMNLKSQKSLQAVFLCDFRFMAEL